MGNAINAGAVLLYQPPRFSAQALDVDDLTRLRAQKTDVAPVVPRPFRHFVIGVVEAKHWGIISEIVPPQHLLARARELADHLADGPPLVFAAIKETLRHTMHLSVDEAFRMVTQRKLRTVDRLYSSEDHLEGAAT